MSRRPVFVVTGIRDLDPGSVPDVELATAELAAEAGTLRLGRARGSDIVALRAACGLGPTLEVWVPFDPDVRPLAARDPVEFCADVVVPHGLRHHHGDWQARIAAMLDGADGVLAFTDGRRDGGTAWTVDRARQSGIPVDVVPVRSSRRRGNPAIAGPWSAPVHALFPYVSVAEAEAEGARSHAWASDAVRALKAGGVPDDAVLALGEALARYVGREPELRGLGALVPMPRCVPGATPSALPVLDVAGSLLGWPVVSGLRRAAEPIGGRVAARRLRFRADAHAGSMDASSLAGLVGALVVDDVLTLGGTMEGAFRALARDAPGVPVAGLALLRYEAVRRGV